MINEQEFQDQINRRLSGMTASEQRRMRIRAAINAEMEASRPMKRTFSKALIFSVVVVMLAATVAFAEYFNLFSFFGKHDERYTVIAPYAALTMTEPVLIEHPKLGTAAAFIDSAYFDGLSLNLAYRITQGQTVEKYTPSKEDLALMKMGNSNALVADFSENEPGIEILLAWNQAVENGIPYGYRKTTVYASDHTTTDDGVDIWPDSASPTYNENGDFCEMREFECPLPAEVRDLQELKVNIVVCQETTYYWFDGTNCFWRTERSEVGTMTAIIPRNGESKRFSGTGKINGITCTVSAEFSPMASVITFKSDAPINTFLGAAPEGTDAYDCWVEVTPVDENGNRYRPKASVLLDDRTEFTMPFRGTGTLPETVTVYVCSMWEGSDELDIPTLDGIDLKADK